MCIISFIKNYNNIVFCAFSNLTEIILIIIINKALLVFCL